MSDPQKVLRTFRGAGLTLRFARVEVKNYV
jgi:hypothetical protein